jgi:AraC family transcriptional regulator, regulatory protein of adaptative response / methylated-DNA-[protein]-cysteine methyltransferase
MMTVNALVDDDARWNAVAAKDRGRDGEFIFGVVTTGVFCRPACPARTPKRQNVRFFATVAEAAQQGFRPCRRCRPLEKAGVRQSTEINTICSHIQAHADEPLTLEALAVRAGLSRFHLQRTFKAALGITPTQYVEACRLARFRTTLRRGGSVTDAIYAAGFGSNSRLYERVDTRLGMTPSEYREGGKGVAVTSASAATPLGTLMVAATDRGVCFVQFGESHAALLAQLRAEYPAAVIEQMRKPYPAQFDAWMTRLLDHLADSRQSLDIPFDVRATAFQLKVWRYLQSIPTGAVQSYQEVARGIGQPSAARAVASACAANRVALVVPCHRVIRGDGTLGGYRWGMDRKRTLLDRERGARAGATVPRTTR